MVTVEFESGFEVSISILTGIVMFLFMSAVSIVVIGNLVANECSSIFNWSKPFPPSVKNKLIIFEFEKI